jgi:hypothetical protein
MPATTSLRIDRRTADEFAGIAQRVAADPTGFVVQQPRLIVKHHHAAAVWTRAGAALRWTCNAPAIATKPCRATLGQIGGHQFTIWPAYVRQASVDGVDQLLHRDRLSEQTHDVAMIERFRRTSDDEDGNVACIRRCRNLSKDCVAADPRKHQVEHDQVREGIVDLDESLQAVPSFANLEAFISERFSIKPTKLRIVFDEQEHLALHHDGRYEYKRRSFRNESSTAVRLVQLSAGPHLCPVSQRLATRGQTVKRT